MPPRDKSFQELRRNLKPGTTITLTYHAKPEVMAKWGGVPGVVGENKKAEISIIRGEEESWLKWPHRNDIIIHPGERRFDLLGHRGDLALSYEVTP